MQSHEGVGFQSVTDLQSITRQDTACLLSGDTHRSCLNLTVSDWLVRSVTTYFCFPGQPVLFA